MTDVRQDNSDEKRRRLLKGALGASTVVTLGYGGAAAAASLVCLEKLATEPLPQDQFVFGDVPPAGSIWVWKHVDVLSFKRVTSSDGTWSSGSRDNPRRDNPRRDTEVVDTEVVDTEVVDTEVVDTEVIVRFDAFKVGEIFYYADGSNDPVPDDAEVEFPQPEGYPKNGLVLAYFNSRGELVATYPEIRHESEGPATGSCLASINPGALGNAFGG